MKEADVGFSESITISDRAGTAGIDLSGRKIPVYTKTADGANGSGCEALKFVSDVIVSEADKNGTGGFNAIVDSVICAKSIYYNLHRMLKYMIASQVAKLFIVFVSVFLGVTALTPPEILFCGLVVDFAALIIIAFERSWNDASENAVAHHRKADKAADEEHRLYCDRSVLGGGHACCGILYEGHRAYHR